MGRVFDRLIVTDSVMCLCDFKHILIPASKTMYNSSKQHIKTVTLVPKILNKTKCSMFFSFQLVDRKNTSAQTSRLHVVISDERGKHRELTQL